MDQYKNISSSYVYDTGIKGPIVTIFSWIHGNEPSGIHAHYEFQKKITSWEIVLRKWKLIGITHANEEAIKLDQREVEKNLNRLFLDDNISESCYEDRRAQELKSILQDSDYLLDLHSTSGPSIPFTFSEENVFSFAKKLGISHIISWWGALGWWVISGDTECYINSKWWKGMTFEAGNHDNPQGKEVAYQAILNYLSTLWCIDESYFKKIGEGEVFLHMSDIYIAKTDQFKYSLPISNFQYIKKDCEIWTDGKEKIIAPHDMVFIMPKKESIIKKGTEVFFIGKEI